MKKNRTTALMAAILTGAAMLTGCDTGGDIVTVYGPPTVEEAASDSEGMESGDGGQMIKGFRDMIADKYPEVNNDGSGNGMQGEYDFPEDDEY